MKVTIAKGLCLIIFNLLVLKGLCQDASFKSSSIVYGEIFGNAVNATTINFERVFAEVRKVSVGYRVGVGVDKIISRDYDRYALPANLFAFTGTKKSHLEVATGISYVYGVYLDYVSSTSSPYL